MQQPKLIAGKRYALESLGRVLVLGLGVSGKAVVDYLVPLLGSRVQEVFVAAGKFSESAQAFMDAASSQSGGESFAYAFDCESFPDTHFDVCITSPGISQFSDFYKNAAAVSDEVISEVEFAWRESNVTDKWIAVTGTNGKTTTTSLIEFALMRCGFDAAAVGNIGDACITAVKNDATRVYVVEVSSFQLASTKLFAPEVAVLLNITPDHLTWHGSMEEYTRVKRAVVANMKPGHGVAVMNATDDLTRETLKDLRAAGCAYIPVGTKAGLAYDMRACCGSENAAWVCDETLFVAFDGAEHRVCALADLQLKGAHNVENVLCAAAACVAFGADVPTLGQALTQFQALEHRIEPCGCVHGVAFYNDSKGTNVDATLKAITTFEPEKPLVLLGGFDKMTPLDDLVACAAGHAKAVVCFGAAGDRFAAAFAQAGFAATTPQAYDTRQGLQVLRAEHMADALDTACAVAREGDIIVLSPACSSVDEFESYEQRGEIFKQLVAAKMAH